MSIGKRLAAVLTAGALSLVASAASIALSGTATEAAETGESIQTALVQFYVCPANDCSGIHIFIDSASNHFTPSSDYSYCTNDETSLDFHPSFNGEIKQVSAHFKAGGTCALPIGHNSWLIEVYKDNRLLGKGIMAVTEDNPGLADYYATCDPVHSPWSPVWNKDKLICAKVDKFILHVGVPGVQPVWPDCPSSTTYCHVAITLAASSNPLEGLVACGSFSIASQTCQGSSFGTKNWTVPELKPRLFIGAYFSYKNEGAGRSAEYVSRLGATTVQSQLTGSIPAAANSFSVTDAYTRQSSDHYKTGDSAPPGAPGGPLYFNYSSQLFSATVVLEGYLMRK